MWILINNNLEKTTESPKASGLSRHHEYLLIKPTLFCTFSSILFERMKMPNIVFHHL